MSETNPNAGPFDVFLCHNSADKPEVREIASKLLSRGLKPWLDERELFPGKVWQGDLDKQIGKSKAAAVFVGKSGIGPWQEQEMWAILEQYVQRRCPIIPVILPSVTKEPELPNLFRNFGWVDFRKTDPDPVNELIRGITGEESGCRKNLVLDNAVLKTRQDDADRQLYSPIAEPPNKKQRTQLGILRNRVEDDWVNGELQNELHHELISLSKREMDKMVELPPWKCVVDLPDRCRDSPLQDHNIHTVFDATGLLLILGEPGSGKTTSLLELAAILINRAKDDPSGRVPIVLNLSSWQKQQSIEEWIAAELSAKYRVPKSIAKAWLMQDYLVPLLDGLDEVRSTNQTDCVTAINAFIEDRDPTGLVVCSRLMEYGRLTKRLKLDGAVCLEPLNLDDVNNFLTASGPQLTGLQQALANDPVLQELARTPLMLSIMSLACEEAEGMSLAGDEADSPEVRRRHIFQLYVERMFQRKKSITSPFSQDQVIGWLSWLARKMKEQSQSVFMVEELQPRWLRSNWQRWVYESVAAGAIGLCYSFTGVSMLVVIALLGVLPFIVLCFVLGIEVPKLINMLPYLSNELLDGFAFTIILALSIFLGCRSTWLGINVALSVLSGIFWTSLAVRLDLVSPTQATLHAPFASGFLSAFAIGVWRNISLVETMRWESKQFFKQAKSGLIVGGVGGIFFLYAESLLKSVSRFIEGELLNWLIDLAEFGMFAGLVFAVYGWIISGMSGGFVDNVEKDKTSPNQGISLSLKNGLVAGMSGFLTIGIACWPFALLSQSAFVHDNLVYFPFTVAAVVGLSRGGSSVIKHYALRLILWLTGSTPFHFIPFLDHCAKLILLKKVGGGYIFIHRTLLEYFAELPSQTSRTSSREK